MSYEWTMRCLTPEEQLAIVRQFSHTWKSIGESANEVVAKLPRQLDTDWIVEYLAWNDARERIANDS